jgi:hypothetical protein
MTGTVSFDGCAASSFADWIALRIASLLGSSGA